jgi:hypothetical protein
MQPETNGIPPVRPEAALMGILALLVAERESHRADGRRTSEAILAGARLTPDEIAAATGKTAASVRAILEGDTPKPLPAWFQPARAHVDTGT